MAAPHNPEVRRARGRYAIQSRWHEPDHPAVIAAKRELKTAAAADYIARIVNEAPALTGAQIERLRSLLPSVVADEAVAS